MHTNGRALAPLASLPRRAVEFIDGVVVVTAVTAADPRVVQLGPLRLVDVEMSDTDAGEGDMDVRSMPCVRAAVSGLGTSELPYDEAKPGSRELDGGAAAAAAAVATFVVGNIS